MADEAREKVVQLQRIIGLPASSREVVFGADRKRDLDKEISMLDWTQQIQSDVWDEAPEIRFVTLSGSISKGYGLESIWARHSEAQRILARTSRLEKDWTKSYERFRKLAERYRKAAALAARFEDEPHMAARERSRSRVEPSPLELSEQAEPSEPSIRISSLLRKGSVFLAVLAVLSLVSWAASNVPILSPFAAVLVLIAVPFLYWMGSKLRTQS